ncbi:MAG: hypothetical protein HQK51_21715, partial [Oligoflexia bacterium]|nr:hypothetical protein [Oligoflexia bacterium]
DIGFFNNNNLYITGRKKDLIIVGGENIYPEDIEMILNEEDFLIPGRNVVFGVMNEKLGTEKIVIIAELKNTEEEQQQLIENHIFLLKQKIFNRLNVNISEIIFCPHMNLKKGTAGKISRYLNKQDYINGRFENNYNLLKGKRDKCNAQNNSNNVNNNQNQNIMDAITEIVPLKNLKVIKEDRNIFTHGIIDSFSFTELILNLEKKFAIKIPENFYRFENFETITKINNTISLLQSRKSDQLIEDNNKIEEEVTKLRLESLKRLKSRATYSVGKSKVVELIINKMPFLGSSIYRVLFKIAGIKIGKNVQFLGKIYLKIRGKAANIIIGDNVILGKNVDIRNRENGVIELRERVYLDDDVRLVAARDGKIEIGFGTEIGKLSMITSGGTTIIGEFVMISYNVNINSSKHGIERTLFVKEQPHTHGRIDIANDVWIGSGASILINSKIGEGAVVSSNSLVHGEIPAFATCLGIPAKVINFR